jgi:hypothetical protein
MFRTGGACRRVISRNRTLVTQKIKFRFKNKRYQQTVANRGKQIGSLKPTDDKETGYDLETVKPTQCELLQGLARHLWPEDQNVRRRVLGCGVLILGGKALNVTVPWIFKNIVIPFFLLKDVVPKLFCFFWFQPQMTQILLAMSTQKKTAESFWKLNIN